MADKTSLEPKGGVGDLLKLWRERRGKSQLDLAIDADISQRHLSFIESGRSTPSRQKLISLATALDMPYRDRNALLLAGGYAPIYAEQAWDAPGMEGVTAAVQRLLRQQEPYPAIVMDRYWNVVMTNDASPRFFGKFVNLSARPKPRNMLQLIFDPAGMRPFVIGWERTAATLIARVRREAVGRVIDEQTRTLIDSLLTYPDVQAHWREASEGAELPVVPLSFILNDTVLRYFSMVTTIGAPLDVLTQELRIESIFPAELETEKYHLKHFASTD